MSENKTVIEVNGVKLEVDLRTAKRIDTLAVGDRVKILIKTYSNYVVYPGVVVGFEPFDKLPTIVVAYMEVSYAAAELKFVHFNAETKETEIIKAIDNDEMDLDRAKLVATMDRMIEQKQKEADDLKMRKEFFLREFRNYWRYEGVDLGEKVE